MVTGLFSVTIYSASIPGLGTAQESGCCYCYYSLLFIYYWARGWRCAPEIDRFHGFCGPQNHHFHSIPTQKAGNGNPDRFELCFPMEWATFWDFSGSHSIFTAIHKGFRSCSALPAFLSWSAGILAFPGIPWIRSCSPPVPVPVPVTVTGIYYLLFGPLRIRNRGAPSNLFPRYRYRSIYYGPARKAVTERG